jgi:cobalamin biosynthesis Mg chelatase CobN
MDKTWGFQMAQAIADRGKKEKGAGMTQDEIIEMAREAGLYQDINVSFHQALKNFYDLATAKEREACAKVCDELAEHLRLHKDFDGAQIAASLSFDIRARGKA